MLNLFIEKPSLSAFSHTPFCQFELPPYCGEVATPIPDSPFALQSITKQLSALLSRKK